MGILIRIKFGSWDGHGLQMNRHYKPTGKYTMRPVETISTAQDAQKKADKRKLWNKEYWDNERWKDDCAWERAREYEEDARDGVYPYQPSDFKD